MEYFEFLKSRVNKGKDFARTIGVRIVEVKPSYARGELIVEPTSLNPVGVVHGGALATLADTTAGAAAYTNSKDAAILTINCSMNFLRAAKGEKLVCEAKAQRAGRTLQVYDTFIYDQEERLVATGCFTFTKVPSTSVPTTMHNQFEG